MNRVGAEPLQCHHAKTDVAMENGPSAAGVRALSTDVRSEWDSVGAPNRDAYP